MDWLRSFRPAESDAVTLICFPHAGGGAAAYAAWRDLLPAGWGLEAVRYPGREDAVTAPPAASLGDIVTGVTDALTQLDPPGPVVLFGHSLGAILAYETAHRRQAAGQRVDALAVSGIPPWTEQHVLTNKYDPADPASADPLAEEVLALDPESEAVFQHPALKKVTLMAVTHDMDLLAAHTLTEAPLAGVPLLIFSGTDDPSGSPHKMEAWRARTTGFAMSLQFPGGHFYLRQKTPQMVQALEQFLLLS
ncbi:MAG: alpha/beta fold hydrolase [Propionibacteriaceae bacterium]|jgi:pyochelin biosynthetic protein PchC|nr:alpha/beta fold hydrolase [Propionibacteriaceae bacterium]